MAESVCNRYEGVDLASRACSWDKRFKAVGVGARRPVQGAMDIKPLMENAIPKTQSKKRYRESGSLSPREKIIIATLQVFSISLVSASKTY